MSRFTNSILTLALTSWLVPAGVTAQTKVTYAPQQGAVPASLAHPQKVETQAKQTVEEAARGFKSKLPLDEACDRQTFGEYVLAKGQAPQSVGQSPAHSPFGPEDDTVYRYTGYDAYAGLKEDSTETGGMVNFNLEPFKCDTISSDIGLSSYSFMAHDKLYCFLPKRDNSTGQFTSIIRTIYDAKTLKRLDQKTFSAPGPKDRVPYIISYDNNRDVVFAISMGKPEGGGDSYYLNVLDTVNCKLQRLGYLGNWLTTRSKGNLSVKGFSASEGILYIENRDNDISIEEIDPLTCKRKHVGTTGIPSTFAIGLQPMIYDNNKGKLLVNHYDYDNGSQFYWVATSKHYGAASDTLSTTLVGNTSTGYTYFYDRHELTSAPTLDNIADLTVNVAPGYTTADVSFTIPTKNNEGKDITFPSYASKNVKCYYYVDGQYISTSTLPNVSQFGSKVTGSVELTPGLHTFTVLLSPSWQEMLSSRTGKNIIVGYDAPGDVTNAKLAIDGLKATISWTAPTTGKYSDFGSDFDTSDIKYTVVRNDSVVVAKDIIATTCIDSTLSEDIKTYSYTIYASSHGMTNNGTETNEVSAGRYLPLPYENSFSDSHCIDGWTIINVNDPGTVRTWDWNHIYYFVNSYNGTSDDWLITPKFNLQSDKLYAVSYKLSGEGTLYTTAGKEATVDGQDNIIGSLENYDTDTNWENKEYYFHPATDGAYNFGFYDYTLGTGLWRLDDLKIQAVGKVGAPDKVRGVTYTPDAKGALGATLSFKLPATSIEGKELSDLRKVTVYDLEGHVMGSTDKVIPGADCAVKVAATHGWNDFKIVASNVEGEGWPVIIRKYVGLDTPKPVTNLTLTWGDERTIARLDWDAPTEGVHGGYVDPSAYTYKIYKYVEKSTQQYTELAETPEHEDLEIDIKDASANQDQYIFAVTALNGQGESDYVKGGIVLGQPYDLPFDEPFNAKGINHSPWLIMPGKNNQSWTIDQGFYNEKIQPQNNDGLQLVFINTGTEDGSSRFIAPIIDFTKANNPVFSVWLHHSDGMPKEAYATVVASVDGSKRYIAVGDTVSLADNNGWEEHAFDLSKLKGKKAQIALEAYLPNPSFRVFADNWTVKEATGNDLALAAISQPYMPVVGDTADITVTVVNKGAKTADNYSVMFNLNGETIAEEESDAPLAIGQQAVYHFTLPITAVTKDYIYSAEVMYDGDTNPDNNTSTEVELNPTQISLPAPTTLTLTGDDNLSWIAPERMDGQEVTLDFENVPAFTTNEIDGWKTIDRDGHLTLSFLQYYGNYWPYYKQPLAWMTWSAKEAGCSGTEMWCPYRGEKCLIHWGNYGMDATGRPNTDPDDDWFISPEVKGGTEFSFMTLSNDASSSIEVLTSSTDDEPESFTNKVKTVTYEAMSNWYEVKVTLPEDAKYVAIHTVLDAFGILVDNVKYTKAKAPQLLGYNIYNGSDGVARVSGTAAKASGGNGTYAVSAVYDLGESGLSNSVDITTGITDVALADAKVYGGKGIITVTGVNGNDVTVFNLNGQKIASITAAQTETIRSQAGVYVVKVGSKTYKVNVR